MGARPVKNLANVLSIRKGHELHIFDQGGERG